MSTFLPIEPSEKKEKKNDSIECKELKSIKYNMQLSNSTVSLSLSSDIPLKYPTIQTVESLNSFLSDERKTNSREPWAKLNKTIKLKKLYEYIDTILLLFHIDPSEHEHYSAQLQYLFATAIERKKLQNSREVVYSVLTGELKSIPILQFNADTKTFTLKNVDKRASTLNSLRRVS